MYTYFKIKTHLAQNLIDVVFSSFECQKTFPQGGFSVKGVFRGKGLISEKWKLCMNKSGSSHQRLFCNRWFFLQHTYSVLVAKNDHKIQSRCLVHEFLHIFFNDINHGYRAAILKTKLKKYLWLHLFYLAVATYRRSYRYAIFCK